LAFPYVYSDAPVPEFYTQVRQEDGKGAIADHPLNTGIVGDSGRFARALYYQTAHERPIAGGKSWRILEEGRATTRLVHALIAPDDQIEPDIYAAAPGRERVAWLSELGFQYVVVHKYPPNNIYDWKGTRPPEQIESERQHLTELLSAPLYEDPWILAFGVPADEHLALEARPLIAFSHGWTDAQKDAQGRLLRQMAQEATIEIYAATASSYRLVFDAHSTSGPYQLSLLLDDQEHFTATVDQEQTFVAPALHLRAGLNTLSLRVSPPCPPAAPRCSTVSFMRMDWQPP
jgi:hypothetical protein